MAKSTLMEQILHVIKSLKMQLGEDPNYDKVIRITSRKSGIGLEIWS